MSAVPVPVAAVLSTAVVELVTDRIESKFGMLVPLMLAPTSEAEKLAVADVMVALAVLWPSVTVRGGIGVEGVAVQLPPMQSTEALMRPPERLVVS